MGRHTIRLRGFQPDHGELQEGALVASSVGLVAEYDSYRLERASTAVSASWVPTFTGSTFVSGFAGLSGNDISSSFFATNTSVHRLKITGGSNEWTQVGTISSSGIQPVFAQLGDMFYVIDGIVGGGIQSATALGTFSTVVGSPKANYLESVGQFLFVANTATDNAQWVCSGLGDATIWTPSTTTQCATNTIRSAPGPITGLKRLGENIVIYKRRSMFLGRYVGASNNTWAFEQIPGHIGTMAPFSIVDIGYAHFFMGIDDVYVFDGTRPVALRCPLVELLHNDSTYGLPWQSNSGAIVAMHDADRKLIYWLLRNSTGTATPYAMVFNYEKLNTQEAWSLIQLNGSSWAGLINSGTAANRPSGRDEFYPGFFKTDKAWYTFDGTATSTGTWKMAKIGDAAQFRTLKRITPNWITPPESCLGSVEAFNSLGTSTGTASISDSTFTNGNGAVGPEKLDFMLSGRWFGITLKPTANGTRYGELRDITLEFEDDGTE